MGMYFNPDNEAFKVDSGDELYVDKTELINVTNKRINTINNCICLSHARRFGKSLATDLLVAYYSKGCDSKKLFSNFKLGKQNGEVWQIHLNKYNVIQLDIASFLDNYKKDIVKGIINDIKNEIKDVYGDKLRYDKSFVQILGDVYITSGSKFVIIIDEWDTVLRNYSDDKEFVHEYLQFLHIIFKSLEAKKFLALGYITGIFPIKKIDDESALNNFKEYTMLKSKPFTEYYGFTEDETKEICVKHNMNFSTIKKWYNGYWIDGIQMYNPNSVIESILREEISSWWRGTSSYETINKLLTLNFSGMKEIIVHMLAGERIKIDTSTFQNDISELKSIDDVLTVLIHLGYLGYDRNELSAYIPNHEVATAFESALKNTECWGNISTAMMDSSNLLDATINKNEKKVAEYLQQAHEAYTSILQYNDENSLSCVLTMAYFAAQAYYNIIREFPTGKGYADFALLPLLNAGNRPAMILELKYNKSANTAIKQIKEKNYTGKLSGYKKNILLVGINYSKRTKKYTCKIEEHVF